MRVSFANDNHILVARMCHAVAVQQHDAHHSNVLSLPCFGIRAKNTGALLGLALFNPHAERIQSSEYFRVLRLHQLHKLSYCACVLFNSSYPLFHTIIILFSSLFLYLNPLFTQLFNPREDAQSKEQSKPKNHYSEHTLILNKLAYGREVARCHY